MVAGNKSRHGGAKLQGRGALRVKPGTVWTVSPSLQSATSCPMSTLDAFVKVSKPPPQSIATSQEVRDRSSIFVGNIFAASTPDEARKAIKHLKHVVHGARPATHEIAAWRCMTLKTGKSGLSGPDDFAVDGGSDDDGEKYGGSKVLKVMQTEGVIDAVVIVSRWYVPIMHHEQNRPCTTWPRAPLPRDPCWPLK